MGRGEPPRGPRGLPARHRQVFLRTSERFGAGERLADQAPAWLRRPDPPQRPSAPPVSATGSTRPTKHRPVSETGSAGRTKHRPVSATGSAGRTKHRPVSATGSAGRTKHRPVSATGSAGRTKHRPVSATGSAGRTKRRPVSATGSTRRTKRRPVFGDRIHLANQAPPGFGDWIHPANQASPRFRRPDPRRRCGAPYAATSVARADGVGSERWPPRGGASRANSTNGAIGKTLTMDLRTRCSRTELTSTPTNLTALPAERS